MADLLRIKSYGGHTINKLFDGSLSFYAFFDASKAQLLDSYAASSTMTERPGQSPVFVRSQPNDKKLVIDLAVEVTGPEDPTFLQSEIELLASFFSPSLEEQPLVVVDDSDKERVIDANVEKWAWTSLDHFKVALNAASLVWRENTTDEEAAITPIDIITSGQEFTLTNPGDFPSRPYLTFKPTSAKTSTTSYPNRRRVTAVSRSELKEFSDPNCPDGGPLDITEGAVASPGDGHRVLLYSREQPRWIGNGDIWTNNTLPPRTSEVMTLGADIDDVATTLSAGNPAAFLGLPDGPASIVIGTERIGYSAKSADSTTLVDLIRGLANTVAASHSAGAPIYGVGQNIEYLDILYGKDSPSDPPVDPDREPVIDLSVSTNSQWKWSGQLYVPNTHRSGQWVPQGPTAVDGSVSGIHIRLDPSGDLAGLVFEDKLPQAGRPRFNNMIRDFACGVKAGTGILVLDFEVDATMLFRIYATDTDGNESRLVRQWWSNGAQTGQSFDSGDVLKRLRLNARIGTIAGSFTGSANFVLTNTTAGIDFTAKSGGGTITFTLRFLNGSQFVLEKVSSIDGVVVIIKQLSGTRTLNIFLAEGVSGFAGNRIADLPQITTIPNSYDYVPTFFANPVVLNGGTYEALYQPSADSVVDLQVENERIEPNMFMGQGPIDLTNILTYWNPDHSEQIQPALSPQISPCFAILSEFTEPQSDAPFQTGNQIKLSNALVLFDDDTPRTPQIICADAEVVYLFGSLTAGATLTNTTTGEFISFRWPSAMDKGFAVDLENHVVTDLETGYQIPHIITEVSNPTLWPGNVPGDNVWTWEDEGIGSGDGELQISGIERGKWL